MYRRGIKTSCVDLDFLSVMPLGFLHTCCATLDVRRKSGVCGAGLNLHTCARRVWLGDTYGKHVWLGDIKHMEGMFGQGIHMEGMFRWGIRTSRREGALS